MESAESEAAQSREEEVDAEDLGEVKGWFPGPGVLPDFQVPVSPVPDGGQHEQAGKHDVSCSDTLEAPEAGINAGFTGNAPTAPAAGHAKT